VTALIGHAEAVRWLEAALASGRVAHAYLLTGPRGVGRRTFALEIARALNCEQADAQDRPCGHCRACRLIARGVHPDVRVVRRAPDRRFITLKPESAQGGARGFEDNVEFIQADAQLRPTMARAKVYLILNAEELTPLAADRLLKTLEEPPVFVHFLLTAADRGAVPPTVASRCQEIRLRPAPRRELVEALVAAGCEPVMAERLATLSGGRQGVALAAATDQALIERQQAAIGDLASVLSGSRLERLTLGRRLAERWQTRPETVRETLRAWLAWWHDVLLAQVGLGERLAHLAVDELTAVQLAAQQVAPAAARRAAAHVQQTLADLEANVNARLALDLLVLRQPSVSPVQSGTARASGARP
jgi:DNA polymerase III subunit delta'